MLGFYLGWTGAQGRGRAISTGEVRFAGEVLPDSKLATYRLDIRRIINRRLVLGVADGSMEIDGEPVYEAKDLRVGLFTRPDDT